VREFKGRLDTVIATLKRRATEEQSWSKEQTGASLTERRTELVNALDVAAGEKRNIPGWTSWLDARIEEYVETYEASPFATFGTEASPSGGSTPASKGEGPGLRAFKRIEDDIKARAILPPDEYKARCAEVRRYGAMLIDVPKVSINIERVDPTKLLARWLEDIKSVFPSIAAQHDGDLRDAFNNASYQSDFYKQLNASLTEDKKRKRASAVAANKRIKTKA
jgi:hypothetical protein